MSVIMITLLYFMYKIYKNGIVVTSVQCSNIARILFDSICVYEFLSLNSHSIIEETTTI